MSELINFRDFGGQTTSDGRKVRTDRLYRCGHMAELGEPAIEQLLGLDFSLIADLRYVSERETDRSPWPAHYEDRIFAHDGERNSVAPHVALLSSDTVDATMVAGFFGRFYPELPFHDFYRPLFARTVLAMADNSGRSLIHCTAGKDRTGVLCFLILTSLGVPRDQIMADYLRSSGAPGLIAMKPRMIARTQRQYGQILTPEAAAVMVDVKPDYLLGAIAAVETQCGSVEAYLAQSGVDSAALDRLRDQLLEN